MSDDLATVSSSGYDDDYYDYYDGALLGKSAGTSGIEAIHSLSHLLTCDVEVEPFIFQKKTKLRNEFNLFLSFFFKESRVFSCYSLSLLLQVSVCSLLYSLSLSKSTQN